MNGARIARHDPTLAVRPILKWAGGKRQLLPELRRFYPRSFSRYFEPFLGSGAVFLDLYNIGLLERREVRLSDNNADVIGCYRMVRDAVEDVITELQALEEGHQAAGRDHFYEVRDARFNPLRRALGSRGSIADAYTPALAAMLIYLNRTGYNGLFRVNSQGGFNVPAGRYGSMRICDADNLRRLNAAFVRDGVSIDVCLFEEALRQAASQDFVYLDPPYAPVSRTAQFTSYTASRFASEAQVSLQRTVITMALRGTHVVLSNSVAPEIRQLYADSAEARRAGLIAHMVQARRAINSRASRRGVVKEYLITNVQPRSRADAGRAARSNPAVRVN